ncbi:MAG: protein phosphatase 2C domain-containing protein [Cyanobacteria bacterium P01_F01_bin.150]
MQQHPTQQHIEIAAGSVQGHVHRRKGQNNQDAFAWRYLELPTIEDKDSVESSSYPQQAGNTGAIAVVCDGCGSGPFSEVGARLGAKWVVNAVAAQLQVRADITDPQLWRRVQQDVLGKMRSLITTLQPSSSDITNWSIIQSYLLFTVIGAVMTPETTLVFGVGDGVFAVNDDVFSIGPFSNNAPPYLAYGLMPEGYTSFIPEKLQFAMHYQAPTSEVRSILIGSDGVEDLRAIASHSLPSKLSNNPEPIGDLSQFWQGDRYFQNPDMVRRRLALINRERTTPDWASQQLIKTGGLLPDDTTLVVMRKNYGYLR